jgi:carbamoyl-phosphate synthase small subunit
MQSILILEDGTAYVGEGFGAETTTVGEVVFNTGMTGYQEILTDASYRGQMVVMTYPHIGNTGINEEDVESYKPHVEGLLVREFCREPSNFRSVKSVDDYLRENGIPGIHQIDTRALTRRIREKGSMMGILSNEKLDAVKLTNRLKSHPGIIGRDLVKDVSIEKKLSWNVRVPQSWYYDPLQPSGKRTFRVVAYDFGIKWNILRLLASMGMEILIVPASTPAEEIQSIGPDGVFLSNGPGDPEAVTYAVEAVRRLVGKFPVFGICLGHQIIGLALGAKTYKLKFGHHGSNHPVRNESTRRIEITSQNHNFAVEPESAEKARFVITHLNLNDGTVEGMRHKDFPVFSVQYHPEASPGPHDSLYLFKNFIQLMEKN